MEIKYEAVFGPQELFDGTMGDCEFASEEYGYKFANGTLYYCERYDKKAEWSLSRKRHLTFKPLAMRRIIKTPVWTMEDKQAGRLPEVGSLVLYGKSVIEFLGVGVNANYWACRYPTGVVSLRESYAIKPIETAEEKAARLREEWCIKALSSCSISSEMQRYELKRLGGYIEDIYDALLSGELPMPKKEDE